MGSIGLGTPRLLAGVAAGALAFFVTPGDVRETPQGTFERCNAVVLTYKLRQEGMIEPALASSHPQTFGILSGCLRATPRSSR